MTGLSDERLRTWYAPVAERIPETRTACVSPEAIFALVRRDGGESDRMRTLDHVMSCGACRKDFELLRAVESTGNDAQHDGQGHSRNAGGIRRIGIFAAHPWTWGITALAASLVLAVGLRYNRVQEPVMRGSVTDARVGISLITPSARTVASRHGLTFVWHATPKAVRYTLEVLDSTGTVAYTATTVDTSLVIKDASKELKTGVGYRWWVRSLSVSGEERRSGFRDLKVK